MDMSYPDSRPPFMQSTYGDGWNHYPVNNSMGNPVNNEQFDPHSQSERQSQPPQQQQPSFKRARHSEDNQSNHPSPYPPMNSNSRMLPSVNPPVNKGTANIFYKTRMCAKFRLGACRNGENCNFAHGIEDLRQPPPNWQEIVGATNEERERERSSSSVGNNWDEDQKIIQRMKLCRKFCCGEECPYGDRCNFLHEDPAKYREDSGKFRESSAISIGTTAADPPVGNASGSNQIEINRQVAPIPMSAPVPAPTTGANAKTPYWKTRLCMKFEITGHCPFGDKCHFAHGQAELHNAGGRAEGEAANIPTLVGKPQASPANDASAAKAGVQVAAGSSNLNEEAQRKKCLFKWKDPKKINRIYADWIDDLPVGQNAANQVES